MVILTMKWKPIARYLISRGFSISPRVYESFMASFGGRAKQERILLPTEESPTNQKSGSMVNPIINRTLLTISPPAR